MIINVLTSRCSCRPASLFVCLSACVVVIVVCLLVLLLLLLFCGGWGLGGGSVNKGLGNETVITITHILNSFNVSIVLKSRF